MTKSEYAAYLQSEHWRGFRAEILKENSACERCELPRWLAQVAYDQDLHVHHKTYVRLGQELSGDVAVLCRRCHEIETFGSSKFRPVPSINCPQCGDLHWNPYEGTCDKCLMLFGINDTLMFRLLRHNPSYDEPLWFTVLGDALAAVAFNETDLSLFDKAVKYLRTKRGAR